MMWTLLVWVLYVTSAFGDDSDFPVFQTLEGRLLVPKDSIFKGNQIVLNGGERTAFLHGDGTFQIHGVQPGTHLLDFSVGSFIIPQVRIDVSKKKRGKIRASISEAGKVETISYPLLLEPKGQAQFFVPREEYSMAGMLKNPMVIMLLIFGVMAFLLPKMTDPEQMKEQMQQMGMDGNQPPSLSDLWNQVKEGGPEPTRPAKPSVEAKKKQ